MGPALAVAVGCTMLVMVTFLPAMLVICGRWVFWPKRPAYRSFEPTSTGLWARLGDRISKAPRQVWVMTMVLLAIACLGLFRLDTSGLTTEDSVRVDFESVEGQKLLAEHGLSDSSNTLQVVADDDAIADGRGGRRRRQGRRRPDRGAVDRRRPVLLRGGTERRRRLTGCLCHGRGRPHGGLLDRRR